MPVVLLELNNSEECHVQYKHVIQYKLNVRRTSADDDSQVTEIFSVKKIFL